ncbi:MAG: hypothetical protein K2L52_02855 [Clostridia bacterium]|nr:hypothetical protein [Clostridia bacterium]
MKKEVNVKMILDYKKKNKLTIKEFCEQCNIGMDTYYCIVKGKRADICGRRSARREIGEE